MAWLLSYLLFRYFSCHFDVVSSVLPIGKTKAPPSRPSGGRLALGPFAEWAAGQLPKKEPQPASLLPPEKRFLGKEPPFLSGGPGGCAPWCSFLRLSPEKAGPPAGRESCAVCWRRPAAARPLRGGRLRHRSPEGANAVLRPPCGGCAGAGREGTSGTAKEGYDGLSPGNTLVSNLHIDAVIGCQSISCAWSGVFASVLPGSHRAASAWRASCTNA